MNIKEFFNQYKKPILYWFIFGAAILIAAGAIWWWSKNKDVDVETNMAQFMACKQDSDCVAVQNGCCGCNAGGKNTAINKKFKEEYDKKIQNECNDVGCIAVISNNPSCSGIPVCDENKCDLAVPLDDLKENQDTSNWKTYRNEEYEFEIKYPKNWSDITTNYDKEQGRYTFSDMLGLGESGGVNFTINVRNDKNDVDLFNTLKKLRPGEKFEKNLIIYEKISDITVGGFPAVKYFADRTVIPAELLPIGNEIILKIENITFNFIPVGTENALQKNEFIFNQILSTFNVRFIE